MNLMDFINQEVFHVHSGAEELPGAGSIEARLWGDRDADHMKLEYA